MQQMMGQRELFNVFVLDNEIIASATGCQATAEKERE
jgi:hypothetical protein